MSMHAQPAVDDRQVVGRIAAGDREALTELYQRYQRILFSYLQQLTPDYGLAEELLQDTLVAVWKSAHRFEGRSSVQTWLSRAASGALLGGIWIAEIIFKDYIAATNWLHPVFLFPTTLLPLVGTVPADIFNLWLSNRFELIGTALVLLVVGWLLLRNPEGLLKTSAEE